MKYFTGFLTLQAAQDYSKQCRDMVENFTMTQEYMFAWQKHPDRNEWALKIPNGWEKWINQNDLSKLINELPNDWWTDPNVFTDKDKYRHWEEFGKELIAEFNAMHQHLNGAAALSVITKFKPVADSLHNMALGAALYALQQVSVDQDFTQETKDYFLNKIQNYLSNWS